MFADNLSTFVDPVFAQPELYSSVTLWVSLLSYTGQIFCDFSGYSLMAIGVARTLGFVLPENFRMPYVSKSITEFWHRWHITLSFWLRDYLYISMGGNRKGEFRTYLHLMVTMLLGGLWHGASWNFVIWGGLHGIALAIHKYWVNKTEKWEYFLKNLMIFKVFSWTLTFLFVTVLWIPFRCTDFQKTSEYVTNLFGNQLGVNWVNPNIVFIILIMVTWHIFYIFRVQRLLCFPVTDIRGIYPQITLGFSLLMILMFAPVSSSPFIYFQF